MTQARRITAKRDRRSGPDMPMRAAGITPAPAVDPARTIGHAGAEARS